MTPHQVRPRHRKFCVILLAGTLIASCATFPPPRTSSLTVSPSVPLANSLPPPSPSPSSSAQELPPTIPPPDATLDLLATWAVPAPQAVAWGPNSDRLAILSSPNQGPGVRVYDLPAGVELFRSLAFAYDGVFTPDGKWLVTTTGGFDLYDAASWQPFDPEDRNKYGRGNVYYQLTALPNGQSVVFGGSIRAGRDYIDSMDTYLYIVNVVSESITSITSQFGPEAGYISDLIGTPEGSTAILVLHSTEPNVQDHIVVLDLGSLVPVCDVPGFAAAIDPQGDHVAIAEEGGVVSIRSIASCSVDRELNWGRVRHSREPAILEYIGANLLLGADPDTGILRAWGAKTGIPLSISGFPLNLDLVVGDPVVPSPDGSMVATITYDDVEGGEVQVWSISPRIPQ